MRPVGEGKDEARCRSGTALLGRCHAAGRKEEVRGEWKGKGAVLAKRNQPILEGCKAGAEWGAVEHIKDHIIVGTVTCWCCVHCWRGKNPDPAAQRPGWPRSRWPDAASAAGCRARLAGEEG